MKVKALTYLKTLAAVAAAFVLFATDRAMKHCFGFTLTDAMRPALNGTNVPDYPGLRDFVDAVRPKLGKMQVMWQPLYDTAIYPLAGTTNLSFFQAVVGQQGSLSAQPGNANNAKSLADTNMQGALGMSSQQAYFIQSIEIRFLPGSSAVANTFAVQAPSGFNAVAAAAVQAGEADVNLFYSGGALTLTIGQNNVVYQDGPLLNFPPRAHFELDAALASNSATTAEVVKAVMRAAGPLAALNPGLGIEPQQQFGVTLTWPVAVALVTNNGQAQLRFNGWQMKSMA